MKENRERKTLFRAFFFLASIAAGSLLMVVQLPVLGTSTLDILSQRPLWAGLLVFWLTLRPGVAFISHILSRFQRRDEIGGEFPSVSVIIPAYNEEDIIEESVLSILDQNYPADLEILVVDDGSTDSTWDVLQDLAEEFPEVRVFTQPNQGAGTAQNYALKQATMNTIVKVDADTKVFRGALKEITRPLQDPDVAAVGGNVEVLNYKDGLLARLQAFEYLLAMEIGRVFQTQLRHLMCISGAFGAFRREPLEDIGGWAADPRYGEDFDVTMRLHEKGKIVFNPNAIALTDVPADTYSLAKQRFRWRLNGLRTMLKNRHIFLNRSYGAAGIIGLPLKLVLNSLSFVRRLALFIFIIVSIDIFLQGATRILLITPFLIAGPSLIAFSALIPLFVFVSPVKQLLFYPIFLLFYRPLRGIIQLGGSLYFVRECFTFENIRVFKKKALQKIASIQE